MKTRTVSAARCIAGLLLAALVLMPAAQGGSRPKMTTYETEHYTVKTDVSPQFARIVGAHMEEIHREYARRFRDYGEVKDRLDVVVFASVQDYRDLVPREVRDSTGIFMVGRDTLAAHCENRTTEEVLRTLYHEGFHQFMFEAVSRDCPIWLNEGLAEYFSEATWDGGGFAVGQVPTMRPYTVQQAIKTGSYLSLRSLFALSADQWIQNAAMDARRASLLYCQAWSIAHFLIHAEGGRYAGMLDSFLRDLAHGKGQEEAFERAFGSDIAAFERTWVQYMMSLQPSDKFRCRENMEALMLLASMIYDRPQRLQSLSDLRQRLLRPGRRRWQITRPTGEQITSDQQDAVEALFHCPYDRQQDRTSYVLIRDLTNGVPMLICNYHPGVIVKAYYRAKPDGKLEVVVEEQVRDTVDENMLRAIAEAEARGDRR